MLPQNQTCQNCPFFTPGRIPGVGNCDYHGDKVRANQAQCSSAGTSAISQPVAA